MPLAEIVLFQEALAYGGFCRQVGACSVDGGFEGYAIVENDSLGSGRRQLADETAVRR